MYNIILINTEIHEIKYIVWFVYFVVNNIFMSTIGLACYNRQSISHGCCFFYV